jgi:hypothetical protein
VLAKVPTSIERKRKMAQTKNTKQTFTVQVRVVVIGDLDVVADSLEEALSLGRTWTRNDIVTLATAATEADSSVTVVAAYSSHAWTA